MEIWQATLATDFPHGSRGQQNRYNYGPGSLFITVALCLTERKRIDQHLTLLALLAHFIIYCAPWCICNLSSNMCGCRRDVQSQQVNKSKALIDALLLFLLIVVSNCQPWLLCIHMLKHFKHN